MYEEEQIRSIINLPNTYIGEAPIDVDDCQWIRLGSGVSRIHFAKETYDKPHFSIVCRGVRNREVKERTRQIYDAVKNYVGNGFVIIIARLPHFVGRDDKGRTLYSFRIEYQLGGY